MAKKKRNIIPGVDERLEEHLRRLRQRFGGDLSNEELIQRSFEEFERRARSASGPTKKERN